MMKKSLETYWPIKLAFGIKEIFQDSYGYNNTLRNYQKNYPNKDYMGILNFDILSVQPMEKDHFFVIGKFMLQRKVGDASGHFTLILRRINGVWKIVSDHSS